MRIVITGYGMITALGGNAEETWAALTQDISGIAPSDIIHTDGLSVTLGGQARAEVEAAGYGADRDLPDRIMRLGDRALTETLDRADLARDNPYARSRRALSMGTLLGGARKGEHVHRKWIQHGHLSIDKKLLFDYPLHSVADYLAAKFDLLGPRILHSNACAASAVAIAHAAELLIDNEADMAVAGGVDPLAYLAFAGFDTLGALSSLNCAPYTRSDGLNLGEGAGFLVLEEYSRAIERGARIYAELLGYGLSADAYHPTAPDPRGIGALMAVSSALKLSGLTTADVDYVNGHGTGTQANDTGELKTIRAMGAAPISSTKSMIGHTLGAAGAIEAVVSVMTLERQVMHPTFVPADAAAQESLAKLKVSGQADIIAEGARPGKVDVVVSNSFAFGGNNASLVLAREGVPRQAPAPRLSMDDVCITAVAAVAGAATTTEEVRDALRSGSRLYTGIVDLAPDYVFPVGRPDLTLLCRGVNPRVLRRLDTLAELAVHTFAELAKQRKLTPEELSSTGLVFATGSGPITSLEAFERGMIVRGFGDPKIFPNTVMNAAAGHIAVAFGLHGPTATVCSGDTSGVTAIHLAIQLIRNRSCERVAVVAADEAPDCLVAGYSLLHNYLSKTKLVPFGNTGVVLSSGAVGLMFETAVAAPAIAHVRGIGMTGDASGPGGFSVNETAWANSFQSALRRAGLQASDIDAVVAAANGRDRIDSIEAAAIKSLGLSPDVPVIAPRGITGDMAAASPLLGVLVAYWLKDGSMVCGQPVKRQKGPGLRVLVSGFCIGGSFQSYVVEV